MPPQAAPPKPAPPYNPNKTPKQRFVEMSQWIGEHRQMVDSVAFTRGCDFAMLQFQADVTSNITDGTGAGSAGLRMQGAQQFLQILRTLSETSTPSIRRPDDNLQHK
jgi:hypothetical protein